MRIGTHVYVSAMLAAILLLGISCGEQSDHIQDVESENDNPSPAAESGNPDNGEGDSAGSDTTGEEKEADARHGLSDPEFLARFAGEDLPGEVSSAELDRIRRIFSAGSGLDPSRLEGFVREADFTRLPVARVLAAALGAQADRAVVSAILDRLGDVNNQHQVPAEGWRELRPELLALVRDENEELAADAIPVVCTYGGEEVETMIAEMVSGKTGLRRLRSIRWVKTYDLRHLAPELEAIAANGADREQLMAIQVLSIWETDRAKEIFTAIREDPDENATVRRFAESGLERMEGGEFFVPVDMGGKSSGARRIGRKPSPEE